MQQGNSKKVLLGEKKIIIKFISMFLMEILWDHSAEEGIFWV